MNEPFFLIALDLGIWFSAAAFFPLMFWVFDAGINVIRQAFFASFHTELITTTVAPYPWNIVGRLMEILPAGVIARM